ncbi:response regulator [Deinococcus oregonensis]|uniref:Response regulator n=1 Tax=Deinococcus oregonensis TaxID=1805970 RepID=A0ABV6AZF8_9DEIO
MSRALRVLLIDDNADDRLIAEEAFAFTDELVCFLTTAVSGQEALDRLRAPETVLPDVVLLDINMPIMSGFAVLAAFKADPKLAALPVVMLSTSRAEEDITQAYTLHASAYLFKSLEFQTFLAQVEAFIGFWRVSSLSQRVIVLPT